MTITMEESEAYQWAILPPEHSLSTNLANALRRHVAAEMRLEFYNEDGHGNCAASDCYVCGRVGLDPRHNFSAADWERAAHETLMGDVE